MNVSFVKTTADKFEKMVKDPHTFYIVSNAPSYTIPSWSTGTDEEIVEALQKHYAGEIDLTQEWEVGQERVVHLNAMEATGVGESHVAQDVTMVLMNVGGKTLVNPINGHTECAFIVGQKNVLNNGTRDERGYMNSSDTVDGGWNACARRTWCNSVYKNAFPSTLVGIFKEHQNITANGEGSTTATSNDYFALPSEKEVFGTTANADSTAEASNTQFKYYETSSNRFKYVGYGVSWWERSPFIDEDLGESRFCLVGSYVEASDGENWATTDFPSSNYGLVPFGVI